MRSTEVQPPPTRRVAITSWCLVLLAAGLEVMWALALTEADGTAHAGWTAVGITVAVTSLIILTLALRALPLSSAYTTWIGVGAVGVALAGVVFLEEPLTPLRTGCLGLIIAGVIGVAVTDASSAPRPEDGGRAATAVPDRHAGN